MDDVFAIQINNMLLLSRKEKLSASLVQQLEFFEEICDRDIDFGQKFETKVHLIGLQHDAHRARSATPR